MPKEPRLSELSDFIPAGAIGTPDYGAAAATALLESSCAPEFVGFLAHLTAQHFQPTPVAAASAQSEA